MDLAAQVFAHLSGQRVYLPVACFACHAASILRMFSSSMALYQSLLAPVRSFLVPLTCPRFIACSFPCGRWVCDDPSSLCARSLGRSSPCSPWLSALSWWLSLAQR